MGCVISVVCVPVVSVVVVPVPVAVMGEEVVLGATKSGSKETQYWYPPSRPEQSELTSVFQEWNCAIVILNPSKMSVQSYSSVSTRRPQPWA